MGRGGAQARFWPNVPYYSLSEVRAFIFFAGPGKELAQYVLETGVYSLHFVNVLETSIYSLHILNFVHFVIPVERRLASQQAEMVSLVRPASCI